MPSVELSRQRFLDRIHRYLQGRLDLHRFRSGLNSLWAEERQALWSIAWQSTRKERCMEYALLVKGEQPQSAPSDPRRFCRMLDRLTTHSIQAQKEDAFRATVEELLAAYHQPEKTEGEARYVASPPSIPIFERSLPGGQRHQYPCTVGDIRMQLAQVPEYDLEGLWSIGLCPCDSDHRSTYGCYYRRHYPERKPVIVLWSDWDGFEFKANWRSSPGYFEQFFRVELEYGMQLESVGARTVCRWSKEAIARYMVEHVLLHEIGHHVQYQQRQRSKHKRRLPRNSREQFAEDYAIRFQRQRREQSSVT